LGFGAFAAIAEPKGLALAIVRYYFVGAIAAGLLNDIDGSRIRFGAENHWGADPFVLLGAGLLTAGWAVGFFRRGFRERYGAVALVLVPAILLAASILLFAGQFPLAILTAISGTVLLALLAVGDGVSRKRDRR